jgi:hypothetical protein
MMEDPLDWTPYMRPDPPTELKTSLEMFVWCVEYQIVSDPVTGFKYPVIEMYGVTDDPVCNSVCVKVRDFQPYFAVSIPVGTTEECISKMMDLLDYYLSQRCRMYHVKLKPGQKYVQGWQLERVSFSCIFSR